jgi:hypothetical protein
MARQKFRHSNETTIYPALRISHVACRLIQILVKKSLRARIGNPYKIKEYKPTRNPTKISRYSKPIIEKKPAETRSSFPSFGYGCIIAENARQTLILIRAVRSHQGSQIGASRQYTRFCYSSGAIQPPESPDPGDDNERSPGDPLTPPYVLD